MKFLSATLLALPFALQAQQVQNVKAVQANEEVIVTYDLVDTKPAYVSLYYSKDGGTTFSPELRQVSGDIREKVRPGNNKKVSWAAGKELVAFDGDLIFKVEASASKIGYPKPFADNYFSIEAVNAYFEGTNLKVEFKVTNVSDSSIVKAQLKKDGTMVLDDQGGIVPDAEITISGKGYDQTVEYAAGAGYKGIVTIKRPNPDAQMVSLLKLNLYIGVYQNWITDFTRNVNGNLERKTNKFYDETNQKSVYDVRSYSVKNIPISK